MFFHYMRVYEKENPEMQRRKTKKKIQKPSLWNAAKRGESSTRPEHDFKGSNVRKRHRKPDEIYGDVSIPDASRKE
jgi:hypothetical protein